MDQVTDYVLVCPTLTEPPGFHDQQRNVNDTKKHYIGGGIHTNTFKGF